MPGIVAGAAAVDEPVTIPSETILRLLDRLRHLAVQLAHRHVVRRLAHRLGPLRPWVARIARLLRLPPWTQRPYALPGEARLRELRWQWTIRRVRPISADRHAARTGVREIEEPIGCALCGEHLMQPLLRPFDRKRAQPRWTYHVVRCPSCGFLYRHPGIRPERLGELYAGRYGKFLTGRYERNRRRRYNLVLDAFSPIFDHGEGRRLLDFGCGAGLFLEEARARGFDGYGVDLSQDSVNQARKRLGDDKAHFGAPQDVPEIAAGGFDVVTMWSVLAHLASPVEDVATLRNLLSPDGVLVLLTVNANSLLLKTYRSRWNGFTPNHLKFYAPATLPALLRKAGFEAMLIRPMYGDSVEAGTTVLRPRQEQRLRRNIDRGNQGNMLRAVAFATADGPRRFGLQNEATAL